MRSAKLIIARVVALVAMLVTFSLPATAMAVTEGNPGLAVTSGIFKDNELYSINRAAYGVYTDQACTIRASDSEGHDAVLTVSYPGVPGDGYGHSNQVEMFPGTYYVKEYALGANNRAIGYRIDPNPHRVDLKTSHTKTNPFVVGSADTPITTTGTARKVDLTTGDLPQGTLKADGLAGGVFRLDYYDTVSWDINAARAHKRDSTTGVEAAHHRVWFFRSINDGTIPLTAANLVASYIDPDLGGSFSSSDLYMHNGNVVWPLGTYLMTEVKAPDAYEFPALDKREQFARISQDGEAASGKFTFKHGNEVKKIDIQMEKRDAEVYADRNNADYLKAGTDRAGDTDGRLTQGDTKHDAHYKIYNVTGSEITYTTANGTVKTVANGDLIDTVNVFGCALASDNKTWETQKVRLPASGIYKIVEDPDYMAVGMHNDPNWSQIVTPKPKTDEPNKLYRFEQTNIPKRYGIFIFKVDADTNTPIIQILNDIDYEWIDDQLKKGQGDATLLGAEFQIINESDHSIRDKKTGKWFAKGEVVTTITAQYDAERKCVVAKTDIDELPYGKYKVRESHAPTGYNPLIGDIGGNGKLWETPVDKPETYVVAGWNRYDQNDMEHGGRTPDVAGHELVL